MKYNCNIVQDLIPLYVDNLSSEDSKNMIEEHLQECEVCKKIVESSKDNTIEKTLNEEKTLVVNKHFKSVKKKTTIIGMVTSGILMIPVIVCLICNLATEHALDWFFIVLTALLLTASVIVVPLMVNTRKFMWTLLSSTVSLLLLLMTCCIYTGGNWFLVAAVSCILGISVVLVPFVIKDIPIQGKMKKHLGTFLMMWDCVWLYLLLLVCGIYVNGDAIYWRVSMVVTTYCLLIVWIWYAVIKYLRINVWIKSGILTIVTGLVAGLTNDIMNILLNMNCGDGLKYVNIRSGFIVDNIHTFNANLLLFIMIVSVIVGGLCIGIGIGKKDVKK